MRNLTDKNKNTIRQNMEDFIHHDLEVLILSKPLDGSYSIRKTMVVSQEGIGGEYKISITYSPKDFSIGHNNPIE